MSYTYTRINRNSPAQARRRRGVVMFYAAGGTYNAGRNKAKRAKRARRPA